MQFLLPHGKAEMAEVFSKRVIVSVGNRNQAGLLQGEPPVFTDKVGRYLHAGYFGEEENMCSEFDLLLHLSFDVHRAFRDNRGSHGLCRHGSEACLFEFIHLAAGNHAALVGNIGKTG